MENINTVVMGRKKAVREQMSGSGIGILVRKDRLYKCSNELNLKRLSTIVCCDINLRIR